MALLSRLTVPPYISGCMCCGMAWYRTKSHTTPHSEGGGCFPLCEWCWSHMTPKERLPYYMRLIDEWQFEDFPRYPDHNGTPWDVLRTTLRANVEAGL